MELGAVAKWIARWIHNLKVAGSNPGKGETSFLKDSEEWVYGERKRIGQNCEGDMGLERVGKSSFFLVT